MTRDAVNLGADASKLPATRIAESALLDAELEAELQARKGAAPLAQVVCIVLLEGGESGIGVWDVEAPAHPVAHVLAQALEAVREADV